MKKTLIAFILIAVLATRLLAHHSFAMYDQTKTLTMTGKLTRFVLGANHAQLLFEVLGPDGKSQLDSNGKPVQLRELVRGRVTVLSFIYTRCAAPKACPYATGVLSQLHRVTIEDSSLSKRLRLVSLD